MQKIKNILFDFDGTLLDSASGIVKTMEQTLHKDECRRSIRSSNACDHRFTLAESFADRIFENNEDGVIKIAIYNE